MCNLVAGITVTVVGVVLVVLTCSLSFTVVPDLVESIIISEVQLENNTEQWERFESIPFGLTFNVRIFNISNPSEVLAGGVPVVIETGPYVYKSYQSRIIEGVEGDKVMYRKKEYLEFDAEASFPLSLDDKVTIVNVAYHNILQMAETLFPTLMNLLPLAMGGVFGVHNSPIMTVRVGDLLFDGIPICKDPGLLGSIACNQIRPLAADVQNIEELEDGSLEFTILRFKHDRPSDLYVASRGVDDVMDLGVIRSFNGSSHLDYWLNSDTDEQGREVPSARNMLNGTDAGIFPPFVNRDEPLYAFNTDVCRSAELRYQYDTSYKDIPVARFAANDWFLDNHQGCFCLNKTRGINRDDGCLLSGAMEMFTCIDKSKVQSRGSEHMLSGLQNYHGVMTFSNEEYDAERVCF
ncbi:sensory neuron membrane protein 2-like [Maniola jurtina]|uniref:sensory neuron membrane protein 2-like n=1 Tax=Maniola jurtina TaxID=191418 RepID=UPI001E687C68|nr:sensory neuron membrane protein 2-like [Maniola jurtina]